MSSVNAGVVDPVMKGQAGAIDTMRESAVIRLVYLRKTSGKLWVQKVELKVSDIEQRLYDVILVSWGQSAQRQDLEFVLAIDEDGGMLASIEGLTHYVAHTMSDVRKDYETALLVDAIDD